VHPDDVAERVAEEYEILRARLRAAPALLAGEPELVDRFEIRVPFTKIAYQRALLVVVPKLTADGMRRQLGRQVPLRIGRFERQLILRSCCDGYDGQAPTAELLQPDGSPLPGDEWPRALGREAVIRGHEDYDRPFFCRRGLREYHSHPHHEDNPWDAHRESVRLYDVIPELLGDLQTRWALG
jgi:hypothetical protein